MPTATYHLKHTRSVVVGAGQGLGSGIAIALAKAGSDVVVAGRSLDGLAATADAVAAAGSLAAAMQVDVASPESITAFADTVLSDVGAPTILVNCANVRLIRDALKTTVDEWDLTQAVHLRGPFLTAQAFAPAMMEVGYGKIVNFSSHWAARTGQGRVAYSAAKAGISRLTASLAVEWGPYGIRVNAVAPAATRTATLAAMMAANPDREEYLRSLVPLGRLAEVAEVIPTALFLSSPDSDFVTGQTIFVDGGATAA